MSVIQLNNVRKQYNGTYVLQGISLSFDEGGIIGYIGPNGAGKSTTIKILTGIISDFEGEAMVMDMDVRKEPLAVKQHIGYIPEQAALYDVLTPREYLSFIGRLYTLNASTIEKKSWELLRLFGLSDK